MGCIGTQSTQIGFTHFDLVISLSPIPQSHDLISKADRDRCRRTDGFHQNLVATGYLRKKGVAFQAFAFHVRDAIGGHGIVQETGDIVRV